MRDAPRRFTQPALLFVALALVAVLGWSNRFHAEENGLLWDRAVRPYRGYVVPAFVARATDGREVVVAGNDSSAGQVLFVFSKACHFCTQTLPTWRAIDSALAGRPLLPGGCSFAVASPGLAMQSLAVRWRSTVIASNPGNRNCSAPRSLGVLARYRAATSTHFIRERPAASASG